MARSGKNTLLIVLVILVLLSVAGLFFAKKMGYIGQKRLTKVSVEQVKNRTIVETVSASGKIYPEVEVKLTSDVSGEIIQLLVQEGDSVTKGKLLAKIEPDLYSTAVERAQAAVNSAKANSANAKARIIQIEAQVEQARRAYNRSKSLYEQQVVSQTEFEDAGTAVVNMEAELEAARQSQQASGYNVKSAEAGLNEANKSLRKTSLYAPMSGIISRLNVEEGERVVGTAQFEGTELLRIANFDEMELRVDVSENDVVKVREGHRAVVEIDAYGDRKFEGKVTRISNSNGNALSMSNDQVTNFTVRIRLGKASYQDLLDDGNRFAFRPGMSASSDIETKRLEDILTVPIQAVVTREVPDSLKNGQNDDELLEVVFTVNENGIESQVQRHEVKTGVQDNKYIEIKEGLSGGGTVNIVNAPYQTISKKLEDGMEVEVVEKDKLFQKK